MFSEILFALENVTFYLYWYIRVFVTHWGSPSENWFTLQRGFSKIWFKLGYNYF